MGVGALILLGLLAFASWCAIHRIRQIGTPGFKTWPLIGVTLEVAANYHRIYDWLSWNFRVKETMTMSATMPGRSYVFTVDPANVEHILKTNFANYPKGEEFHEIFEPLLGNGIFNSDGEPWRIQRKTASFEFSSRVLRDVSCRVFKDHALKLARIVHGSQEPLEMQDLFMRMTLDTICFLGFGLHLGVLAPNLPRNDFATAFDACNAIISYRFADPFWKFKRFLRIGQERSLQRHLQVVDDFTHSIICQRRLQLQDQPKDHQQSRQDLLSRFMLLDESFSDDHLRDVILNFVIAGRDTTASTLSYFTYMIASHPDCATKIYQELHEFEELQLADNSHRPSSFEDKIHGFTQLLTYESLAKLVYLHAALMETLRLFPAVPLNFKGVVADDVLPSGAMVKRGSTLSYAPYCMARIKSIWGSDASQFRPERWRRDGAWDFSISSFKFTAFQAGPRICLGKDSAFLQMKITAALLCRFFEFQLVPRQILTYRVMATISFANGVKVTTSNRT
ncbi:cytochrome P450 704B1 [Selaginella moellendorffii]|uniref:cytochrome P450 704B1 n=1 Tax=Selaginella moellendorffii TaxID=88036 RepID=UPI000D1CAF97|nr:cytochrome P450 704B1 [Selaginella moellendorffii]|eukprot:XP_024543474.1 cytochrome P450 704B1 [Selaginella moellendorffii]